MRWSYAAMMGTEQSSPGAECKSLQSASNPTIPSVGQLTDAVDLARLLAVGVDDDHLGRDERTVLDEERRAERDDLDVLDKLDLAQQPVRDLVDLGLERVDVLAFAVDEDVLRAVPGHALEHELERVVARHGDVLRIRLISTSDSDEARRDRKSVV